LILYNLFKRRPFFREAVLFLIVPLEAALSNLEINIEKLAADFYKLTCTAKGDTSKNYKTNGDIKAVTYHDMFVKKEKGLWTVQAVVDI